MTGCLPPFGVTAITTALALHIVSIPVPVPADYQNHSGLQDCINALHVLVSMYASAEYARDFLEVIAQKRGLTILKTPSAYNYYANGRNAYEGAQPAISTQPRSAQHDRRDSDLSASLSLRLAMTMDSSKNVENEVSPHTSLEDWDDMLEVEPPNFDGMIDFNNVLDFEEWLQFSPGTGMWR